MDACRIAGLQEVRIINEPTAAAIAYGLNKTQAQLQRVLVFDLGGGTFDISVLQIEDGVIEVLSTRGDTALGGQNFDEILLNYLINDIKTRHEIDLSKNKRAVARLRLQATRAKHALSSQMNSVIEVESISNDIDYEHTLSRATFENLCEGLFNRCIPPMKDALKDANL